MNYTECERELTNFDLSHYNWHVPKFNKQLYQKKMQYYEYAKIFHGEQYPLAVMIFSYIWDTIPFTQPYGDLDVNKIAIYTNHSIEEVEEVINAISTQGLIHKEADGKWNVRYSLIF